MNAKLLLAILAICLACRSPAHAAQPNVIIVDICSARADHFGVYGYPRDTTPSIDKLSQDEIVFENAYSQASWCLPNYATLFTGKTPEMHDRYASKERGDLNAQDTTLAQKLKESGYLTLAYTGGAYSDEHWGLKRGFDEFHSLFMPIQWPPVAASFDDTRSLVENRLRGITGPFFLYTTIDDLHAPYQADDPEMFDRGYHGIAEDPEINSVMFDRIFNSGKPNAKADAIRKDPMALAHIRARYDAALRRVDRQVAAFVDYLKARGLWDNSVVIITADHGEMLGEHGLLGHTESLYQPIVHVPLIVHYPGLKGRRIRDRVSRIDLMPTILEIAGANTSGLGLQGRSFASLFQQNRPSLPEEIIYASSKRNLGAPVDDLIDERAILVGDWKLIWYAYRGFELYNLKDDPNETRNVAAENPQIALSLAFQLMKKVEDVRPKGDRSPPMIFATRPAKN